MPPPTQPCSWGNLSPARYCAYHHLHNHAAGATSRQLCIVMPPPNTTMQLEQPLTRYVLLVLPLTQPCRCSNLAPARYWDNLSSDRCCSCHHLRNHAAGATYQQLCIGMPPPTQPCSWSNPSHAMYCACHQQHNHTAGVTSYQLCTSHATTNTTMQLEQPLTSSVLLMPPSTQPCSSSVPSHAMYCSCHH